MLRATSGRKRFNALSAYVLKEHDSRDKNLKEEMMILMKIKYFKGKIYDMKSISVKTYGI